MAPGRLGADITSDVSSRPDGGTRLRPSTQNRVVLFGDVLDVRREDVQLVDRRRVAAGDRGRARFRGGETRRLGIARHRDLRRTRQMAGEPLRALGERLRVRIDALDLGQRRRGRQEVLPDPQPDLAADGERRLEHEVERAADDALGGILHGDDRMIGRAALGRAEHFVDRRARLHVHEFPEMLRDRFVRVRAGRPEVGHAQRLLEREAGRHRLAEDGRRRPRWAAAPDWRPCRRASTCASRSGR